MARVAVSDGPSNPAGRSIEDIVPGIPRDQYDRPIIVRKGKTKGGKPYTRASTLGGAIEDQFGISIWKMRMALWGLAQRRDLMLLCAAIDDPTSPEGKKALAEINDACLEQAETDAAARTGTALHAVTETIDTGGVVPELFDEHREALEAYRDRMLRFRIIRSETFVAWEAIETAGTFDRLIEPLGRMVAPDGTIIGPGDRLIMDIKTSSTSKYFGLKFAVQLCVYAHGEPYRWVPDKAAVDKMDGTAEYPGWPDGIAPRTDWALILHVPSDGTIAEWFWVDLTRGRELADLAGDVMAWRKVKGLVVAADEPDMGEPERPDRALHAVPDLDADGSSDVLEGEVVDEQPGEQRAITGPSSDTIHTAIRGATNEAALTALWERFESIWQPEHTDAVRDRLGELEGADA